MGHTVPPAPEATLPEPPPAPPIDPTIAEATRRFRIRPEHELGFYVEEVTWRNTRSRSGGYQEWKVPDDLPSNLFKDEDKAKGWIMEALRADSAKQAAKREEREERRRNYRAPYEFPPPRHPSRFPPRRR
jgi:hypothetical protein